MKFYMTYMAFSTRHYVIDSQRCDIACYIAPPKMPDFILKKYTCIQCNICNIYIQNIWTDIKKQHMLLPCCTISCSDNVTSSNILYNTVKYCAREAILHSIHCHDIILSMISNILQCSKLFLVHLICFWIFAV